jgi:uncharacterized protein
MSSNASATHSPALSAPARWLLLALASVCLLLGLLGIVVPVLPTVPFLILAAWCASRSSPRLHNWLLSHPHFGRPLRDWNDHGVVPRRAKWFASVMMALSATSMLLIAPAGWLPAVLGLVAAMLAIGWWLWRRPEHRP